MNKIVMGVEKMTRIFWFSGSGNSFYVAKKIAEGIGDAELVHVSDAIGEQMDIPENMGLVFPVYAWGPPAIVADFIDALPEIRPEYTFAVATCGASAGPTMSIVGKMLGKRGIQLKADFIVKMVENYPPMGGAPSKDKQDEILEKSRSVIQSVVDSISSRGEGSHGKKGIFFSLLGRIVYPLFRKNVSKQAKKFHADEKCTSCGVCVRVCPVDTIQLDSDGRPVWGNRFQQCFACFHWCPEEAVQYGKKTPDQVRYHHPEVSLEEMFRK